MALFKLRKKVDEPMAAVAPAESIEAMRRRARHRLIGAVVLVLAGVIGFPLLFDTQPRPVAADLPIEIPDRNKARPLPAAPAVPVAAGKVQSAPVPAGKVQSAPVPVGKVQQVAPVQGKAEPDAKAPAAAAAASARPEPEAAAASPTASRRGEPEVAAAPPAAPRRAEADHSARADDPKARALLEGRSLEAGSARFVVQVGAFAESDKARQAQLKLERAGLRNYTHVAETEEGKRIRVRAGPFASRAEADRAAEKIKGLDLPARILTL